jgi:hypothetical protein
MMIHGRSIISLTAATAVEMRQDKAWLAAYIATVSWSNRKKSTLYFLAHFFVEYYFHFVVSSKT